MLVQILNMNGICVVWIFTIVVKSAILQETETDRPADVQIKISNGINKSEAFSRSYKEAEIDPNKDLWYASSQVYPKQVAVLNPSAPIGMVIDTLGEKVAILNGNTGRGVVLDQALRMGVMVEEISWQETKQDMKLYLADINVPGLMDMNSKNSFSVDDQGSILFESTESWLSISLSVFGEFASILRPTSGRNEGKFCIIKAFMKLSGYIIHPLKNVLGPVLKMVANGWAIIKCGIMGLVNIFHWFGILVSYVVGGFTALIGKAVLFPLVAILTAVDGARALFCILKELAMKFNLKAILCAILCIPAKILSFIAGLGGAIVQGVTGIFSVLASFFNSISVVIKESFQILLEFLGQSQRPKITEITSSCNELLTIVPAQEKQYNTDLGEFRRVLSAVSGSENYQVDGVDIGKIVKLLTGEKIPGARQVVSILDKLRPALPMNRAMPQLLGGVIRMLNTTNGASYIGNIFPSIKVPVDALKDVTYNHLGAVLKSSPADHHSLTDLRSLPAPEVLRRLPIVSSIYRELEIALRIYDNTTLDDMLMNDSIADTLVEVTTRALEMPVS